MNRKTRSLYLLGYLLLAPLVCFATISFVTIHPWKPETWEFAQMLASLTTLAYFPFFWMCLPRYKVNETNKV